MENSSQNSSQQNSLMFPRVAHNYADLGYYPTDDATVMGVCQRLDTRFEKIRIFAQSLLKIAPSRARFAMPRCYI